MKTRSMNYGGSAEPLLIGRFVVSLTMVLFLGGCAATPPRMSPHVPSANKFYWHDMQFGVSVRPESEARIAVESAGSEWTLVLACRNLSARAVDLIPDDVVVVEFYDSLKTSRRLRVFSAREYKTRMINEAAMAQLATALNGTFATMREHDPVAREVAGLRMDAQAARVAEVSAAAYQAVTSGLLGRETLQPGEAIVGEVRVDREMGLRLPDKLHVEVPFGNDRHTVEFSPVAENGHHR